MKAKAIAAKFITEFGKEDPDYLTVAEFIDEIYEGNLEGEALEAKMDKVIDLISRADVTVSWGKKGSQYLF